MKFKYFNSKRTWYVVFLLIVIVLFLFTLTGCSWWGSEDTLRLWDVGPVTLDPAISGDMSSHLYIMQIFSGLVRLDHELNIVPDIAEGWELSSDNKTYTFHLYENAKFHNGKDVKADDFKYSWERACDPETGSGTADTYLGDIVGAKDMLAGITEEISGIEVIGDYTLQVTIDAPKAYFLSKLAYPTAFVVDRNNVESGEDWWREPEGTGPFKLKEWQAGQGLILERNQTYYGELAKLEQVQYLLYGSPMVLYETGQIDVVSVFLPYIDRVRDETGPFYPDLVVDSELSLYYIGFNTGEPPFDDVNVRRAFCHAVDKERIAEVILRDMVSEADGILPPGMPGYNEALAGLDYDIEEALGLITASKYGDVSNLPPITLTVDGYGNSIPGYLGAIIQEWQQNLGVEISLRQLEPDNFLYNVKQEKDEMFVTGWVADYPDPHNFLDILFHTGSEGNISDYSNHSLDTLLDQAAIEQNEIARLSMYGQAEQLIVDDAPCLPLFHGANYILVEPYVKDYELSPVAIPDLSRVYINKG
jgi:oligopeptide transport system substrate-binding protein